MGELINEYYKIQVLHGDTWLSAYHEYSTLDEAQTDLQDKNNRAPVPRRIVRHSVEVVGQAEAEREEMERYPLITLNAQREEGSDEVE